MFRSGSVERRLLGRLHGARRYLLITVGLGVCGGALTVLQAHYLSRVVARVFLGGATLAGVTPLLWSLLLAGLLRALTVWGSEACAGRAAARVKTGLRSRLFAHVAALGPLDVRSAVGDPAGERSGELVNTLVEGIEALDAYFSQYLPQLALAALVPLTVLVFVAPLDLLSGLVLLLTAPLIPVFMILIGSLAEGLSRRQWGALSHMSAHFLDVLQGLTTLKLFGRSREQVAVIAEVGERFRETTMGVLQVGFLSALVLELLSTLSTAVVAVEIGLRLLYGHLSFEQALFVLILAPEFYLPLRTLGTRFHASTAGVAAARRIFAILDTPTGLSRQATADAAGGSPAADVSPGPAGERVAPPGSRRGAIGIEFAEVSYAYAGRERPALDGVSFAIRPGEHVALVGPSGGGKSTVARLLLCFIEPSAGRIRAGGVPLISLPVAEWRSLVAWVPQIPYLFYGTVADNIRLGRPGASIEEVMAAARQAHADGFIRRLPQGYDTLLGERGAGLSGGEAQRIALARAFLKDAPVVIFDEATANLDPAHEALIQASAARLLDGRTALIITHRLYTIERADRVVVLSGGRLVEEGTPADLAEREGIYRRLLDAGGVSGPRTMSGPGVVSGPRSREGDEGREARRTRREPCWRVPSRLRASWPSGSSRLRGPDTARGPDTTPGPAAVLGRLFSLVAPFWPWILLSVLLGFATIASGIGLMATAAWIIASAALQPSVAVLQVAIVGVRFFGVARGGFRYLERLVSHQVTFRLLARLRVWFYAALEPLAPARLMAYRSGDLLGRAVADIETLQHFYIRVVAPPVVAVLVALLMWVFMGSFDRRLAFVLSLFLLAAGAGVPLLAHLLSRDAARRQVAVRADLNAVLLDGIQGLADLAAFGQEGAYLRRVEGLGVRLAGLQERLALFGGANGALSSLLTSGAVLAVLVVAIPLVTAGRIDGVNLAVLALAAAACFEAVSPLPLAAQYLEGSLAAGRRLLEVLDARPLPDDVTCRHESNFCHPERAMSRRPDDMRTRMNSQAVTPLRGVRPSPVSLMSSDVTQAEESRSRSSFHKQAGSRVSRHQPDHPGRRIAHREYQTPAIAVENLTFRYNPAAPPALAGVTFSVPPGGRLAVVGPSGAGKSSLANLLLRFWDYQAGSIRLDGQELRAYDPEAVRARIGVVAQRTHLFNATIRDNLLLARPDAGDDELERAARRAQIHDFIAGLPEGYDTWIGEQGLRLSGGERQRLAIARALLKDAPILILDEATANLDPFTERSVLDAIRLLMAGRTTLTITHRLPGLETMDEILVLNRGRIVARGTHRELLARGGLYRRMWAHQWSKTMLWQAAAVES